MMLWGPLADRFGRLPPLYVSLAAFVILAAVCATTDSFEVLVVARCLQGVAGGGGPVIARAIARDMGGGARTIRLLTTVTAILSAAPLLSPIVGSGLLIVFEWPSVFWALMVFGAVIALATFLFVPETRPQADGGAVRFPPILSAVNALFRSRDFVVGTMLTATVFGGYAVLLSIGASVAEVPYGIPPQLFGFLFAIAAVALVIGSVCARLVAPRLGLERVVTTGAVIAGLAGAGLLIVRSWSPQSCRAVDGRSGLPSGIWDVVSDRDSESPGTCRTNGGSRRIPDRGDANADRCRSGHPRGCPIRRISCRVKYADGNRRITVPPNSPRRSPRQISDGRIHRISASVYEGLSSVVSQDVV